MIYNNISQWRGKEDISRWSTITLVNEEVKKDISRWSTITLVNEEVKKIFHDDLQ